MKKITFSILFLFLISLSNLMAISGDQEERKLSEFSDIEISGAFTVKIIVGEEQEVIVETKDPDHLDNVITKVKGSSLIVEMEKSWFQDFEAKIFVKVKKLETIQSSGANSIKVRGIDTDRFKLSNNGAGSIDLEGKADYVLFSVSGAASIDAKDLKAEDVKINISGAANASVYASESVSGDVSGVANLNYYGNPRHVDVDDSGMGSVNRR
ncbi:MAG: hypothetical protein SCALA702_26290 [Melioribacteraceae bacterium]|nr:MAG: hypothetical protein SCALA702_26290 [Melioribacteraceae bacterium]